MVTPRQLAKYGKEEAKEHHTSYKKGKQTAMDHINRYGPGYYPAVERVEKKLLQRQNKKKKR